MSDNAVVKVTKRERTGKGQNTEMTWTVHCEFTDGTPVGVETDIKAPASEIAQAVKDWVNSTLGNRTIDTGAVDQGGQP